MKPNTIQEEKPPTPDTVKAIDISTNKTDTSNDKPGIKTKQIKTCTCRNKSHIKDEMKLTHLIENVKCMAIFAAEKGLLPAEINLGDIYNIWHQKVEGSGHISKEQINLISGYYSKLEVILGDVSAFSLKATSCNGIEDCMKSDAGRYVTAQIYRVYALITIIVATHIYGYYYKKFWLPVHANIDIATTNLIVFMDLLHQFSQYLIPFTFGTLGAMAFILRFSVGRLHKREFDPRRIPGNYIRIVLGTICGGAIVMFVNSQATPPTVGVTITAASLGFLAGYSTDFLFEILDRLKSAINPARETQQQPQVKIEPVVLKSEEPAKGNNPQQQVNILKQTTSPA